MSLDSVLPRIEMFWLAIGRGRIEPSAIKWRKEAGYRRQHVFVIWAGGAMLRLDTQTGNLAWFVDNKRRNEQRAHLHDGDTRLYGSQSGEIQAMKSIAIKLGLVEPSISHYYQRGVSFGKSENSCRRFGGDMNSEVARVHVKIQIQSSDGHVIEMFAGSYRSPTFRVCSP